MAVRQRMTEMESLPSALVHSCTTFARSQIWVTEQPKFPSILCVRGHEDDKGKQRVSLSRRIEHRSGIPKSTKGCTCRTASSKTLSAVMTWSFVRTGHDESALGVSMLERTQLSWQETKYLEASVLYQGRHEQSILASTFHEGFGILSVKGLKIYPLVGILRLWL